MKNSSRKVKVSDRALHARINRALDKQGEKMSKCRSERYRNELGDYYIINMHTNVVIAKHVELEECGRNLEVLKPYEELES